MNIDQLTQIVNKHDPIHLIQMGAPDDEYQPEIGEIFVALQNKQMEENELAEKIKAVFVKWFDETTVNNHGVEVYTVLAHDIFSHNNDTAKK